MRAILLTLALAGFVPTQDPIVWGGEHIELHVAAKGATLEFDCAHATIGETLRPDAQGVFHVKGTFTSERSGPVRDDVTAPALNATFSGTIKDDAMTLKIVIEGQDAKGLN